MDWKEAPAEPSLLSLLPRALILSENLRLTSGSSNQRCVQRVREGDGSPEI